MANTTIPNLPLAISLDGTEQFEVVQAGTSKRATVAQIGSVAGIIGTAGFAVINATTTTPPASPTIGDAYIIPSGATGVWATHVNAIAVYGGGAGWLYFIPKTGWQAYDLSLSGVRTFNGTFWQFEFQQAGTGAQLRTHQDKERERVSVRDYLIQTNGSINAAAALGLSYLSSVGGGVLDFVGIVGVTDVIELRGLSNITLEGSGAQLTKNAGVPYDCRIFWIHGGCYNIEVRGFKKLDGTYDGATIFQTDNKPVILVGAIGGDGGATNDTIHIHHNTITRSMWGGIVVYGATGVSGTPLNRNINIYNNNVTRSSQGIFIYKNAQVVKITNNYVYQNGYDGIICDTMAASDPVTTEPVSDVLISGNTVDTFGMYGFGVGVIAKGAVSLLSIADNVIRNAAVNSGGSFSNYGINISADSGTGYVSDASIHDNKISNILSSQANSGYGINVGSGGHRRLSITYNHMVGTTNHALLLGTNVDSAVVEGNTAYDCGNGIYSMRCESILGSEITNLVFRGNIVRLGPNNISTGGFYLNYIIGGAVNGNRAPDFTSTALVLTNTTQVEYSLIYTGTTYPTSVSYYYPQGAIVRNSAPSYASPVLEWICISGGSPGGWRPKSWLVGIGVTGSRPTLAAAAIGVTYLDTTLAANGKLITWTGTLWVDATGASV